MFAKIKNKIKKIRKTIQDYIIKLNNISHIKRINNKIKSNNKNNIIPVIIDCEVITLNQYLEPVVEELLKLKNYKFNFYFGESKKRNGISYCCYKRKNAFSNKLYQYLKGDMVFLSPHIYPKGPPNALKIFFDHSMCNTKYSFHPKEYYNNYNIYCVTGKLNKEKVIKRINELDLNNKIKVTDIGFPKTDKLFNGNLPCKIKVFSKINLEADKKTILYAPSWEKGLSLREYGIDLIKSILDNKELNLIVKLHPVSLISKNDDNYNFYTGGLDWLENISKFKHHSNFVFINDMKIDEYLYISDIMITDLSSAALEFLVLDKPVIYLDCPAFEETYNTLYSLYSNISYSELLNDPDSNAGRHVGLINHDYRTILNDIEYLISNPAYKKNERKEYSDLLLFNKGIASKTAAEMILENYRELYE